MDVTFGKHTGKSVESLVIKEPQYIAWIISQSPTGAMRQVKSHAQSLISAFDTKPFQVNCEGRSCEKTASRCTVYLDNVTTPYWWCDNCNPYESGANSGKLQKIKTYSQAVQHVELYCGAKSEALKSIIRLMARAKGLAARSGEKNIQEFFS